MMFNQILRFLLNVEDDNTPDEDQSMIKRFNAYLASLADSPEEQATIISDVALCRVSSIKKF